MDCATARLLIEALHDDELEVADVAALVAHLGACCLCAYREREARALRALWRARRPVDRCPHELRVRLTARLTRASRRGGSGPLRTA